MSAAKSCSPSVGVLLPQGPWDLALPRTEPNQPDRRIGWSGGWYVRGVQGQRGEVVGVDGGGSLTLNVWLATEPTK